MPRIKAANKENDSGAPRGRGRPPKRPVSAPREVDAAEDAPEEPSAKRGRGRPKKNVTPVDPPAAQSHGNNQTRSVTPTKKSPKEVKRMSGEPPASNMSTPKSAKRGRPRKVPSSGEESPEQKRAKKPVQKESDSESGDPESSSDYEDAPVVQKKRGRPKKQPKQRGRPKKVVAEEPEEPQSDGDEQEPEPQPKKKRGRKKKQVDVQPGAAEEVVAEAKADEPETPAAEVANKTEVSEGKEESAASVEAVVSKKKRGRPPKAKPKQQETKDSVATSSAKNETNEEEEDDDVLIIDEVHDSVNPVDTMARAVSPPTATLPQKILATPDGSVKDSGSDSEEDEEENEDEDEEEEKDGENEKSGSEDDDENGSEGGNGGESGQSGDHQEDGDDNQAPEDEEESEDDEPQNSQQTSDKTARCTTLAMRADQFKHYSMDKNLTSSEQMRKYWSKIAATLSADMLVEYKNQLQGVLTGRVSSLESIEKLVLGFPESLVYEHEKLYELLCQTTGAYPYKNHMGTTLVSRFWLADHNQIGAQIVLHCLSHGIMPFDVLKESSVCQKIQNIVRIGIKDILDEAHCLLPKNDNVIRREHIPMSLTTRLLTAV